MMALWLGLRLELRRRLRRRALLPHLPPPSHALLLSGLLPRKRLLLLLRLERRNRGDRSSSLSLLGLLTVSVDFVGKNLGHRLYRWCIEHPRPGRRRRRHTPLAVGAW
jgi:hypothetical protein